MGDYALVPVGERHHDVEGGQEEAEVEEGVAVSDAVLLVVHGPPDAVLAHGGLRHGQDLPFLGLHQLVDLGVGGGADAAEGQSVSTLSLDHQRAPFKPTWRRGCRRGR